LSLGRLSSPRSGRVSQLCGVAAAGLIALGVLVVCQMVFIPSC